MSEPFQIGQILVDKGMLDQGQVDQILQEQRTQGVPFGLLAERMFGITAGSIERAWADQYQRITGTIDLTQQTIDQRVLGLVTRRQAWQFEMMPLHHLEPDGELVMAASARRLPRAVTFAANRIEAVVYFRVADTVQLRQFLRTHYPMPEISPDMLDRARMLAWPVPGTTLA